MSTSEENDYDQPLPFLQGLLDQPNPPTHTDGGPLNPIDQALAQRLLEQDLVSPEELAACLQPRGQTGPTDQTRVQLAEELLRRRLLPAWRLGQLLLTLHSGSHDAVRTQDAPDPTAGAGAPGDPPVLLGRYPVTGQLGAGGMGQVLAVRDQHLGRLIAAKVIRGCDAPEVQARFIQEAQITGQLEHPNIVPTYELGMTTEGQIYFTMKRIEGEDLAALLALSGCGEGKTRFEYLQILLKVCDAMSLAHSKGVIHRDLKPANIMVGRFGEVQVMDWGLARLVGQPDTAEAGCTLDLSGGQLAQQARQGGSAEPLKTLDGMVSGTPCYMPPEQARGEVSKLDRRADVYALGAILYQMLTLELPFRGKNGWEVLQQVTESKLIPPAERTPQQEIPRELEAVVLKAMASTPAKRYDSVALMKQDIQAYLEGRLLQAADYTAWQVAKKWAARHKPAVLAAAVLLSVIMATIGIIWQLFQTSEQRDLAQRNERIARSERREANKARKSESARRQEAELANRKMEVTDLVRKAQELKDRRAETGRILKLLTEAEQKLPDHSGLLRLQGELALDQKKWPRAKGLLERALKQDPKDYVTHFLLYRWHAEQGKVYTPEARKHVWEAAQHGTRDSAVGLWGLGRRAYVKAMKLFGIEKTKALERAEAFCTQALEKRADFVWAIITRGSCYRDLGAWKKALADYDTALRLNPRYASAYLGRGKVHRAMKRYDNALDDFDTTIRLSPRWAKAFLNRGTVHLLIKRYDTALDDLDKAIHLNPRYAAAYWGRGKVHRAMKRYDKALADYGKAIGIDPRYAPAYLGRGRVHRAMKEYDKALADYGKAIGIDPRHAPAYFNRGNLHRMMNRRDEALADYAAAIRIDPRFALAYNNRGSMHLEQKRYDKALEDYHAAIRIDPRYALAYMGRGKVHFRRKHYRLALADWERALPLLRGTAGEKNLAKLIRMARAKIK